MTMCKICKGTSKIMDKSVILGKFPATFFRCDECGFIFINDPIWLNEAYENPINDYDTGLVSRNLHLFKVTRNILHFLYRTNVSSKYIDYGGGYGLFVRLMRDNGYLFYWHDKFSQNLFAKGFEANLEDSFDLLTAIEVFEHLVDPLEEIYKMLRLSPNLLFTTELVPQNPPKPGGWWYYGLEHGQHVSFYTKKSLSLLAETFNLNFYTNDVNIHMFSAKSFSNVVFKKLCHSRFFDLLFFLKRKFQVSPT